VLAKPILSSPSTPCQANTLESRSRAHTVKLLVPGYSLQAASHNSHRYISASAIPMPLFESQAVVPVHRYSHAALFFPGDLVGPEAVLRSAASCIIFSGLDAGTPPPPPPPPPPLDPLVRLVPLVLAAVVKLYFPGWRSSIPALAKKIVCSR